MNHSMLAGSAHAAEQILEEAADLCRRVKTGSDDPNLGRNALHLEAYCQLMLNRPEKVLEILEPEAPVTGDAGISPGIGVENDRKQKRSRKDSAGGNL